LGTEGFLSSGKELELEMNLSFLPGVEVRKTKVFFHSFCTLMAWCLSTETASNEVRDFGIHSVEALGPTTKKLILHGQDIFCIDVRSLQRGL
jgi:hypothetical protein